MIKLTEIYILRCYWGALYYITWKFGNLILSSGGKYTQGFLTYLLRFWGHTTHCLETIPSVWEVIFYARVWNRDGSMQGDCLSCCTFIPSSYKWHCLILYSLFSSFFFLVLLGIEPRNSAIQGNYTTSEQKSLDPYLRILIPFSYFVMPGLRGVKTSFPP